MAGVEVNKTGLFECALREVNRERGTAGQFRQISIDKMEFFFVVVTAKMEMIKEEG